MFIMFNMHVHSCMHVCLHGVPLYTYTHPHTHPSTPPIPKGGDPLNQLNVITHEQIKIFQFCLKIYNLCRLPHRWVGVWFCGLVDGGVFLLTFDCLLKAPQPITGLFL